MLPQFVLDVEQAWAARQQAMTRRRSLTLAWSGAAEGVSEAQLVRVAAAVEASTRHPLADAITESARQRGAQLCTTTERLQKAFFLQAHVRKLLSSAFRASWSYAKLWKLWLSA